jgi:hypothetical protein
MKSIAYTIILATFLILSPKASYSSPSFSKIALGQPDSPIPIISSKFYVGIRSSKDKEFVWTESNLVPSIPDNSCYSWEIELDTYLASIPIKEIFILPERPKAWNYKEDSEGEQTLQYDNKVSIIEKISEVKNRIIANTWCVAEGDPTGNYKIEVYIKGVLAESFSFMVGLKL